MDILFWISGGYMLLLTYIWLHELGHYAVDRFLVKIPKENIQIRLFQYPAVTAKLDSTVLYKYDSDGKKAFLFVLLLLVTYVVS